jgi:flagellar hook-length control protein FliK
VESEEVSGQIQKLMPSIIDNLNQKGLQFAALDVQVRNFGDNRKREKETGSANITREPNAAEPEAGLSTNNQSIRNYGYNTVEYVA